jgi:hypothetical protein
MSNQPIKGPWEAEHHKSESPASFDDPGYYSVDGIVLDDKWGVVADTLNRDHRISPDEDRAHALLIAAAPELLALCREMENWLRPEVTEEPDRTYFWKLIEVIRKAEGKTPLFVEVKS